MLGGPDPARGPEVAHPWLSACFNLVLLFCLGVLVNNFFLNLSDLKVIEPDSKPSYKS
jgi:hypothetical protein